MSYDDFSESVPAHTEGPEAPKCPICTEHGPWRRLQPHTWICRACETVCWFTSGFMTPKPLDNFGMLEGSEDKRADDARARKWPAPDRGTEI